jgi:anti-sigma B factor antagonist
MAVERKLTIPGILAKVPEACEFVVEAANEAQLDERASYYCQMSVDEWCTNIIEHGFENRKDQGHIDVLCSIKPHKLIMTITDNGPAFDPRNLPIEAPNAALEEREPGGLGWFFINKFMDEVHYELVGGRNQLTLIKRSGDQAYDDDEIFTPYPTEAIADRHIWVIRPAGRLDSSSGQMLNTALNAQLDAGHHRLVIDMDEVNYISSGGLKVLIAAWRKAQALGGTIVLAGMQPKVYKVFEISGFDSLFTITGSVDDAAANIDK